MVAEASDVGSLPSIAWRSYCASTDYTLKIIDCFLVYFALVAAVQLIYCLMVGTFPFNSFLAGFLSSVGMFIITVGLRIQVNPANKKAFEYSGNKPVSKVRAFVDWLLCNFVLHVVVFNFIG